MQQAAKPLDQAITTDAYTCKQCKDTGEVATPDGFGVCDCQQR